MLYFSGVGLAFFLCLLMISKKGKTLADKVLMIWLLVMTIHLLLFCFSKIGIYPELLGVDFPLPLTHGPLLFLYTLALTRHSLSWKTVLLHFSPSLVVQIYMISFILLPTDQKIYVFEHQGEGYETFLMIRMAAIIASGIAYVILSSLTLQRHRKLIKNEFSFTEKINLNWLQYLIYWLALIWIIVIVGNDDLIFTTTVFFILFIGYFGMRQVGIFTMSPFTGAISMKLPEDDESTYNNPEKPKYYKSGLRSDQSALLHDSLRHVMTAEKLYCKSELSLVELAEKLNTQPNHLSQVINEIEGKNFYDYINTLRVEEFIQLASNPESKKYTLQALAQECGFNSKSSFNRYFKKVTGQSPSDFIQASVARS